jgi:hypothetical protein
MGHGAWGIIASSHHRMGHGALGMGHWGLTFLGDFLFTNGTHFLFPEESIYTKQV